MNFFCSVWNTFTLRLIMNATFSSHQTTQKLCNSFLCSFHWAIILWCTMTKLCHSLVDNRMMRECANGHHEFECIYACIKRKPVLVSLNSVLEQDKPLLLFTLKNASGVCFNSIVCMLLKVHISVLCKWMNPRSSIQWRWPCLLLDLWSQRNQEDVYRLRCFNHSHYQ